MSESRLLISDPRHSRPLLRSAAKAAPPLEAAPSLPGITLRPEPLSRSPRAVLYQGWDRSHHRRVVVKVQRAADDPVAVRRFGREGAVLLRLRHPSIVRLYAFHPSSPAKNDPAENDLAKNGPAKSDPAKNDPAALVMEYVPGTTLAALVAADGWLPPARAVQIIEEVAAALDCVHALGVVHRDIKPSNILLPSNFLLPSKSLLPRRGPAKLTDFGLVRADDDLPLTVMGDILGTIEYASPEQVHGGGAVDARSDVYSLAAVTYFALTGTPPFRAADASTQSQLSVMHRQVFSNPPPLRLHREDLSPAIEDAVLRGLAKAPEERYASAGQLAAALRAAVAASAGKPQQKAMEASARRTGIIAGASAGAVLLAGLAFWTAGRRPPPPVTAQAAVNEAMPGRIRHTGQGRRPTPFVMQAAPKQVSADFRPTQTRPTQTAPLKAGRGAVAVMPLRKPHLSLPVFAQPPQKPLRIAAAAVHRLPISTKAKTAATVPAAAARAGWYTVSGWIALPGPSAQNQSGQKPQLVRASPAWVQVDGHPLPQLASGQWVNLPAGTHRVTFQPAPGLGVGPKTWTIKIAPSAHLSQQVPLPSAPLPDIPTHLRNP